MRIHEYNPRDWKSHPPYSFKAYGSSIKRAPLKKLVPIQQTLSEITGPLFSDIQLEPGENDLTRDPATGKEAMRLKRRAFVEKLDFITSPGHLSGGDSRSRLGLPGKGPEIVITDRAILNFDNADREMQLSALYPGVSEKDVRAETGWDLRRAPMIEEVSPPSPEELRLIRQELDPSGMYR